jgi:hypothetical protein
MKQSPCDKDLYLRGRTSAGIAWATEILVKVTPMRMPPPIKVAMSFALAEITAPTNAIKGGTEARYLRSTTSERRPTMGDRVAWMRRGPCCGQSQLVVRFADKVT